VAHAFNNLLTVIIGSTELLIADQPAEGPLRAHLETIMRAATRGATVTRQLLAVGGRQPIDRTVLDLNVIVTGLEASLRRVAGPHCTVTLNLEPTLPHIEGALVPIEQVLLHLASNAADAMDDEGTIVIETSSTLSDEVRARHHPDVDPGDYVWLTVHDTGRGMDAQTREHLFEPFYTAKSASLGTGLGLPVVYGIVHQLGGTIAVDSEVGRGTTFSIALRRAATIRETQQATTIAADEQVKNTWTIVLVDDEDDVRSVMKSVLRQKGYAVLDASSGAEAIRLLAEHAGPIDMLVTDVLMPGMSGRELYEHLVRCHPGLKVLYVSGFADEAFDHEPGGSVFLSKPFSLDTLARKVSEGLTQAR
jgi:CheY-like chemotaxis protein